MSGFQHGASAASAAAGVGPPVDPFKQEFQLFAEFRFPLPGHIGFDRFLSTLGALLPATDYDPASGNHNIDSIYTQSGNLVFRMDQQNVPNTDQTFTQIEITGRFLQDFPNINTRIILRTEVTFYNPTDFGDTLWSFTTISPLDMTALDVYDVVIRWAP
jgi:hypothetical protein